MYAGKKKESTTSDTDEELDKHVHHGGVHASQVFFAWSLPLSATYQ